MMNILKQIEFHYSFYLIAFSFTITGYFKYLIILTSIILVHELGHFLIMRLFNYNIIKIVLYPFGGIIKSNNKINSRLLYDFLIAISGIIFQIIYFLLIIILYKYNCINANIYNIFKTYNINIILLNILPIIPLDGSKVLNIFFNTFLSYRSSYTLTVYSSLIFLGIIILNLNVYNYSYILLISVILVNIYKYYNELELSFNKFLLERYIYKIKYKKIKIIDNKNNMMREYTHIFKNKKKYLKESDFLANLFDMSR